MNEQLKKTLDSVVKNIESRKQSEKLLVLSIILAGLGLAYLSVVFDLLRAEIQNTRNSIAVTERQIEAQQLTYQGMVAQSQEDPNRFANDRLEVVLRQQAVLDSEIQALAGNLVTPNQMTEILTTVLERQAGLELVSFQNSSAQPLRDIVSDASELIVNEGVAQNISGERVTGQVYSHGLTIEFDGDFFSTLKYLRFLEEITGSFFWDGIRFEQLEWPNAHVTLRIHTLSANQGFIGA